MRFSARKIVVFATMLATMGGCGQGSSNSRGPRHASTSSSNTKDDLIQTVAENLNNLDQFDPSQLMPQMRDRLNQWVYQTKPSIDWQKSPLLETLPEQLRDVDEVKKLESREYALP